MIAALQNSEMWMVSCYNLFAFSPQSPTLIIKSTISNKSIQYILHTVQIYTLDPTGLVLKKCIHTRVLEWEAKLELKVEL